MSSFKDINEVGSVLVGIDENIEVKSLVDCQRLGLFDPLSKKPYSILTRLARPIDIQCILSRRNNAMAHSIRAYLSRLDKANNKLLLREKWSLIEKGTHRIDIKISQSTSFVNGNVHARVSKVAIIRSSTHQPKQAMTQMRWSSQSL